jgi:hypothetical protein
LSRLHRPLRLAEIDHRNDGGPAAASVCVMARLTLAQLPGNDGDFTV